MEHHVTVPPDIDIERPSPARIYDYHLGGSHNFAADRQVARQIAALMPQLPVLMRANRAFLRRAVRFCLAAGVDQFLDLGSGIPTVGNVHEIAQRANPAARVVYVDVDPVAVAHSQTILAGTVGSTVLRADLRNTRQVLDSPQVRDTLDLGRRVAVLMLGVLHFVPDADAPDEIVAAYRDELVAGSPLVVSHAARDEEPTSGVDDALTVYTRDVADFTLRSREEVTGLFAGFDLVPPGLVTVNEWRPDEPGDPVPLPQLVAVGRKR